MDLSWLSTPEGVDTLRREILSGELQPFEGELRGQDGRLYASRDSVLTNEDIITMDWLNENIIGEIPAQKKIVDSAQGTLNVSGVPASKKDD